MKNPIWETQEETDKFWEELVKSHQAKRKVMISLNKMNDPLTPKRLSDAITMVGTCLDLCPRFERYRRECSNDPLHAWETLAPPNQKRVDHLRAVKAYQRAVGDKTLPSDLLPPKALEGTLDYLIGDVMVNEGLKRVYGCLRDRTRAVRSDFVMIYERERETR
ncbi:hypothetical protein F5880DRAFT_667368 [Lentinula raphanica]|nr:hypothetical protein F5880DRAFT_667368 [Lentinula raphanica]